MKEYIKFKIFSSIKTVVIVVVIFLTFTASSVNTTSLSVAFNSNYLNYIDKEIIEETQLELFKEGLYNPLYTFTGELTGYVGDCPLCSGYLACPPRTNVLKEGIYFNDSMYGRIRIVASSKNYPCGTILQFNVDKLSSDPIIAIVLDRGVGGNDIDLLTDSQDYAIKNMNGSSGRQRVSSEIIGSFELPISPLFYLYHALAKLKHRGK